jgi:hypothetical protein
MTEPVLCSSCQKELPPPDPLQMVWACEKVAQEMSLPTTVVFAVVMKVGEKIKEQQE